MPPRLPFPHHPLMKLKQWITPFLALGALLVLAACQNNNVLISRGLSIALTKIERTTSGSYAVTWQVVNPNVVSYVVDRSEHKVFLNDVLVGTVAKKARQGVPPQNKAEGTDTLTLASPAATDRLAQAIGQGPQSYRVESTIWVLLSDDDTSKSQLTSSGAVAVTAQ